MSRLFHRVCLHCVGNGVSSFVHITFEDTFADIPPQATPSDRSILRTYRHELENGSPGRRTHLLEEQLNFGPSCVEQPNFGNVRFVKSGKNKKVYLKNEVLF